MRYSAYLIPFPSDLPKALNAAQVVSILVLCLKSCFPHVRGWFFVQNRFVEFLIWVYKDWNEKLILRCFMRNSSNDLIRFALKGIYPEVPITSACFSFSESLPDSRWCHYPGMVVSSRIRFHRHPSVSANASSARSCHSRHFGKWHSFSRDIV